MSEYDIYHKSIQDFADNEELVKARKVKEYFDRVGSAVLKIPPDPHKPGAKLDQDKPDLDLVLGSFTKALVEVGKVGTFGAKKYSDNGWKEVSNAQRRYLSAMQRHYFTYKDSELYDPETNLSHLAHMAWNALAALHFELEKVDIQETVEDISVKTWTP